MYHACPPMWTSSGYICSLAFGSKIALVCLFMNYMLMSPDCWDGWSRSMSIASQLLRGQTSCSVISKVSAGRTNKTGLLYSSGDKLSVTIWLLSAKSYPTCFACREYPGLFSSPSHCNHWVVLSHSAVCLHSRRDYPPHAALHARRPYHTGLCGQNFFCQNTS